MSNHADIKEYIKTADLYSHIGRIDKIVGLTIESVGPVANIGDVCIIRWNGSDRKTFAEVVGFHENKVQLMPYEDLEGIGFGSTVINTGHNLKIPVSPHLVGRTVDAMGNPLDGGSPIIPEDMYAITGVRSNPMDRPRINEIIEMGVKAIDGLLTIGKGQRKIGRASCRERV